MLQVAVNVFTDVTDAGEMSRYTFSKFMLMDLNQDT